MIIDKSIEIIGNGRNIKYYTDKGYNIKINQKVIVKTIDLSNGSTFKINVSCDNCNNIKKTMWSKYLIYVDYDIINNYYCSKCSTIKRSKTNQERYGGNSPNCSKEIVDKTKATNMERYGNNSSLHGNRQEVIENIFMKKYGYKNPSLHDDIKRKTIKTNQERYGGNATTCSKEIMDKIKATNMKRYGVDNVSKNKNIIEKIKLIQFSKHNMYFTQTDEMKDKSKATCLLKYDNEVYKRSKVFNDSVIKNRLKNYDLNIIGYNDKNFEIICEKCNNKFKIRTDLLYHRHKSERIICTLCNKIDDNSSSYELKISEFLDIYNTTHIIGSYKIINPLQIDIYLPDFNLSIEFNGIYWHSEYYKDKKYHYNKYLMCVNSGINLIQIWEDDWLYKKDIIKSMLLNKINKNEEKIFARKCVIKEVEVKESIDFLNNNHLNGYIKSYIGIGLYHNDELVSLMTFYKPCKNKDDIELLRFCNKLNTSVVGSASKLFNYFIKNYSYDKIFSYSDNCISNGDLYKILGFVNNTESVINYYWCDGKKKYHSSNFTKKKLVKDGYDKNLTVDEIMYSRKMYKIFDAGSKKWEYS